MDHFVGHFFSRTYTQLNFTIQLSNCILFSMISIRNVIVVIVGLLLLGIDKIFQDGLFKITFINFYL